MKRWMSVALVLALLLGGAPAPALAQQSVSATELLGHGWWLVTQMVTGDNVIIDDSDPSNPRIIIPPGGSYKPFPRTRTTGQTHGFTLITPTITAQEWGHLPTTQNQNSCEASTALMPRWWCRITCVR